MMEFEDAHYISAKHISQFILHVAKSVYCIQILTI